MVSCKHFFYKKTSCGLNERSTLLIIFRYTYYFRTAAGNTTEKITNKHDFLEIEFFFSTLILGYRDNNENTRLQLFRSESFSICKLNVAFRYKFNSFPYSTFPISRLQQRSHSWCDVCTPFLFFYSIISLVCSIRKNIILRTNDI